MGIEIDYRGDIEVMIRALALRYGVDPDFAVEIVKLESSFRPKAVGDGGLAVGLWQWHFQSWVHVRTRMNLPTEDERDDAFESTITALYAIGRLGLARWWSTAERAAQNVAEWRRDGDGNER
jgi:hypothetical protein